MQILGILGLIIIVAIIVGVILWISSEHEETVKRAKGKEYDDTDKMKHWGCTVVVIAVAVVLLFAFARGGCD